MTDEHPTENDSSLHEHHDAGAPAAVHEPIDEREEWFEEPEELPRRPRRRLLTPLPLALMAVLLTVCGFIGGVLVEKGQSTGSASATPSGRSARIAALLGGSATGAPGAAAAGSAGGGFPAGGAGAAGRTVGQVAYLDGSTLYVTSAEGNTVKVSTSAATTVNKTVKSSVAAVHPGKPSRCAALPAPAAPSVPKP